MGQPMKAFTLLQRKAVCLGLLWGVLSAAETGTTAVSFLKLPLQATHSITELLGIASQPRRVYALAILLATLTTLLIATVCEFVRSKLLYWRIRPIRHKRQQN